MAGLDKAIGEYDEMNEQGDIRIDRQPPLISSTHKDIITFDFTVVYVIHFCIT